MKFGRSLTILVIGSLLYLLFWPVPLNPSSWNPPEPPPLEGPYAVNDRLAMIQRIGSTLKGPEDVAFDAQGNLVTGLEDGRLMRIDSQGETREIIRIDGRPLGLRSDSQGGVVIVDARGRLLHVDGQGKLKVLASEFNGVPFRFLNDVDIGPDGVIYVTEPSATFTIDDGLDQMLEHRATGRLLAYDPRTRSLSVIKDGLYYPNGVAVSPDGRFVLIVELQKYRILRHWLQGDRRGKTEVILDNLPGYPDGISTNGKNEYWLALYSLRSPLLDALLPHPFFRKIIARLPSFLFQSAVKPYSFVLGIDGNGRILHNLQDPQGRFAPITNAVEANGKLYFGSLEQPSLGVFDLKTLEAPAEENHGETQ